jgi:hypothetical protein
VPGLQLNIYYNSDIRLKESKMVVNEEERVQLRNFILNIKDTMMKLHTGKKITKDEGKQIVQFYLETVHYVGK